MLCNSALFIRSSTLGLNPQNIDMKMKVEFEIIVKLAAWKHCIILEHT
jgi:hypothetical protein